MLLFVFCGLIFLYHSTVVAYQVFAGEYFATVIQFNGHAYSWGKNIHGELGIGSTVKRIFTPTRVVGIQQATMACGGANFMCWLDHGVVKCSGKDNTGQLGNSAYGTQLGEYEYVNAYEPVLVENLSATAASVTQVVCGEQTAYALLNNGTSMYGWGFNGFGGMLGDGTEENRPLPISISIPNPVMQASAGWRHMCLVTWSGKAYCVGNNSRGQLGVNSIQSSAHLVAVVNLDEYLVTALSCGHHHTCVLINSGGNNVRCWGYNGGDLATYDSGQRLIPTAPKGIFRPAHAIYANFVYTCVILTGKRNAVCFGQNESKQFGYTKGAYYYPVPYANGVNGLALITGGKDFTCALKSKNVYCVGSDKFGQLGNGRGSRGSKRLIPIKLPTHF